MDDFDNSVSLSCLLCHEDEAWSSNDNEGESTHTEYDPCFALESEEVEYVEELVKKESTFGPRSYVFSDYCSTNRHSWLRCVRLDAIDWILNTRAGFGFRFHTAYLSVTYMDRFLSKIFIDSGKLWAIRLLALACLSLAAKMEESEVPPLSEFPVEDYCFENKVIQKMELLVLDTLEWKMGSKTPFAFLHYFISKLCGESRPKEMVSRAVELTVAVLKEIDLLNHQPSIVAAAAVLAASNIQLARKEVELKMKGISSWDSLEHEHVFSCYTVMQQIEMRKLKTPNGVISPVSATAHSDVLEKSSMTFGSGTKRRLAFTNSDQNCPSKKVSWSVSEFDIL